MGEEKLGKEFFARDAEIVARELLGKIFVRKNGNKILKAKIVETEAYLDENDPASRARQNGDLRKTMLMVPGTILVYGVHSNWLLNFVTGEEETAEAVLIRALEPLNFDADLSGPGKLTKSFDIGKSFHRKHICDHEEIWIENLGRDFQFENFEIVEGFRIGVKNDLPDKMRFYIKGNKHVSKK